MSAGVGRGRSVGAASWAGAGLLAGIAALHVAWGTGSRWPAATRRDLADMVAGTEVFPDRTACFTVAAVLTAAATTVAVGPDGPLGRTARGCVAGGLAVRGVAGLTGATHLLVPWTPSQRFVRLDRRFHGPLCLAIAALVARDLA
jgi:Protein of unknown function (DUF3995)